MPKKFGSNTKSSEAKARKDAVKQADQARKDQEAEDALWQDDSKHVQRKLQRKDDKEKKKQEQLDRKLAKKEAYDQEMESLKPGKPQISKLTRADINSMLENEKDASSKDMLSHDEKPLEENVNRLICDGEEARSVTEAISMLSIQAGSVERHPERRMKAAYDHYEEDNLPRLKAENPNLRLSQLKQMLKKDWMKSPENPMNQQFLKYNVKE